MNCLLCDKQLTRQAGQVYILYAQDNDQLASKADQEGKLVCCQKCFENQIYKEDK